MLREQVSVNQFDVQAGNLHTLMSEYSWQGKRRHSRPQRFQRKRPAEGVKLWPGDACCCCSICYQITQPGKRNRPGLATGAIGETGTYPKQMQRYCSTPPAPVKCLSHQFQY